MTRGTCRTDSEGRERQPAVAAPCRCWRRRNRVVPEHSPLGPPIPIARRRPGVSPQGGFNVGLGVGWVPTASPAPFPDGPAQFS